MSSSSPTQQPDATKSLIPAECILMELIDSINQTGGLLRDEEQNLVPAADSDWIDLAAIYLSACHLLNIEPQILTTPDGSEHPLPLM